MSGDVEEETVLSGIASLALSSSTISAANGVPGDFDESWIDALPDDKDDREFRLLNVAESKCLFFKSMPPTTVESAIVSYVYMTLLAFIHTDMIIFVHTSSLSDAV